MNKHHTRERTSGIRRHSLANAIVCALALGVVGPVLAQQAVPAEAAAPAAQATPQELDTVTVTANKREENIREVAVAVTKLSEQQLENINATQISDYANYVPGLQVQSSGTPGQTQVSMRGVAALSPGSTVGTYVDETPVGSNNLYQQATLYTLDLLPYDIEGIEVLRGPQGTLYGAGAMGGLIKYAMRKPDATRQEFRIGAGMSFPEDGETGFNYRLGMNIPMVQDAFAIRASFASNDVPGYVDNLVDGREDINHGEQNSSRISARWQGESSSWQFALMQQKIDSENDATIALDPVSLDPIDGLSNYVHVDAPFEKDILHYSLAIDTDVGFADFVSATSYAETETSVRTDLTLSYGEYPMLFGLPAGSAFIDNTLEMNQFTQEFRLQSKSGQPFEWLLGGFYSKEDGTNHQFIGLNQLNGTPLPAPFGGILGILGELVIPSSYEETAVFANGSYKFTDQFKLGAGVRFSRNEQEFVQNVTRGILLPIGASPNASEEDVFTWSITPQFQIDDNHMVYAKVSTGYQPGGPNVVAVGLPAQVDSSMLTSYELGWKGGFDDQRLLLDLVAYQIDWEDIQVASLVNGISGLVNGGVATSKGIEASLQWRPINGLSLGLNGAYNDASLDEDFPVIIVPAGPVQVEVNTGLAGDRMPYVPDVTWSATADYYLPLSDGWSVTFGGGYRWTDERTNGTTERQVVRLLGPPSSVLATDITTPLTIDSYGAFDLYASLSNEHWTIRGYMKNAADERAYSTLGDVTGAVTGVTHHMAASPIQPRMYGIEVDYRF